jgi:hypothetical protein
MAMRITREDLYREIWTEPATKIARRYDVSSSYLARVCEGLNVPHPPRGYWARKAVGETIQIPALPPATPGDPIAWVKGVAISERLPPVDLPAPSTSARQRTRPTHHPLVKAWRTFLEGASPIDNGYMVPRKRNVLDAFVTKGMIRSAAEALNTLLIELEMRGHRVTLSAEHHHRPPVDVALREIKDSYERRPNDWRPNRPTVAYVRGVAIGVTFFELTEHVKVRQTGPDRYVRIKDLPPTCRYAPQAPNETDLMRDMTTGRFVVRAYSPRSDTSWRQEWIESQPGEIAETAKAIADALESATPTIAQQVEEAERRARAEHARIDAAIRRHEAEERVKALQAARQAAKDELRSIVTAWNDAFGVEAFFVALSRRAESLDAESSAELEGRIREARKLMGGQDAIERFLRWTMPPEQAAEKADSETDELDE